MAGQRPILISTGILGLAGTAQPPAFAIAVPRREPRLIVAASFDFGFPREQVVAIVFRKVALISDVQHGGHPRGIRCYYYGRPLRRQRAVTQRTPTWVDVPKVALL